jgi:hypothetical protein
MWWCLLQLQPPQLQLVASMGAACWRRQQAGANQHRSKQDRQQGSQSLPHKPCWRPLVLGPWMNCCRRHSSSCVQAEADGQRAAEHHATVTWRPSTGCAQHGSNSCLLWHATTWDIIHERTLCTLGCTSLIVELLLGVVAGCLCAHSCRPASHLRMHGAPPGLCSGCWISSFTC